MITKRRQNVLVKSVLLLSVAFLSSAKGDLADGLVAHWEFEGNFLDSAGTNDATAEGDAKIVTDNERGAVAELDGDGDYLEIANSASLNITGDKVSLAAWVYFDDVSGSPEIIIAKVFNDSTHQSPYFSYGLHILTNGQPRLWISRTGGAANAPGTTFLQSSQWYHLAGVYDGSQMRLYLDGALVASNNVSGNLIGYDTVLRLGINGGRTEPMDGKLDDVRIYNRALSEREVVSLATGVSLYNAWKPVPADGNLAWNTPLLQWSSGEGAALHDVYLSTDPNLGPDDLVQSHNPMALYYHGLGLAPGTTYYWRVDEIEIDGTTVHTGDVWSFMTQALTAYHPEPADGAVDASPSATLTWLPGQGALKHHVYFSDDFDDVNDGTTSADRGEVQEQPFAPGELDGATSYYWRVDEIAIGDVVQTGPVWTFATYLPVDDFESYTDEEGMEVFSTWIDGWSTGTNGSVVGYLEAQNATFGETVIVHGGGQSMPLEYDNTVAPFYSEAERVFEPRQDWTIDGLGTLVLYVRGQFSNAAAPLYVGLADSSNRKAFVMHPDETVATTNQWNEWQIPLSRFADDGVNLAAVTTIYIGLGDRNASVAGGTGLVFVDDIQLRRLVPADEDADGPAIP